jgi:asparagine synthase (glutamine-hydrolysing)
MRYDPRKKSSLNPVLPSDFTPPIQDSNGSKIEKLMINSFTKQFYEIPKSVTISMSGGIDSTLALGILRKSLPSTKIIALCGVFDEAFDESIIAKKIANTFDADFKIIKMPSIFTDLPKIISITKKPKWNSYTYSIAEAAKKYSNYLVTGDGADEVFGGYNFRYNKFLNLLQPHDIWKNNVINYLECHNRDWVPDQSQMFGSAIKFNWEDIFNYFKPYFQNSLKPLQQVMLADFNGKLVHDFVPLGNSTSEYYDIKNFSPYLDSDVIRTGLRIPLSQKYDRNSNKGKIVLRKISKRLGINHIDKKLGFSPGLLYAWKKKGRDICQEYIMKKNSYIFEKKLINHNWVLRAYESVENDGDIRYLTRLISLITLEIWYRMYISNEIKPHHKL